MMDAALYVILVQYGSWLPVLNCLHWLVASGQALDQTVVVANGPGVPPSPWPTRLKGCRLIASPRNIGFAAACNVGLRHAMRAGAEVALVLNPHCFFGPEMLSRLCAGRTSTWQCVAPEIYRAGQLAKLWFGGAWRGRLPGTVTFRRASDPHVQVDYLWACALLAGRVVWEAVGLFDEAYFLYYEDMEWCDRARAFGVELCIVPRARVWHAPGASSGGEGSPLRRYHLTRSAVLYHGLAHPCKERLGSWVLLARLARDTMRMAARGQRDSITAQWLGYRDGRRRLRRMLAYREERADTGDGRER